MRLATSFGIAISIDIFTLPGRDPKPSTEAEPGFPWFIDGVYPMKSPPPPAAKPD
jgi:hypothetical protein